MQFFIAVCLILESLTDQVSAVGGRIDQNIVRLLFQSALDHCFQIFILNFKFFEREIIHIDDKFVIAVLDLRDHIIQILELMFINLNHSQSPVIILV